MRNYNENINRDRVLKIKMGGFNAESFQKSRRRKEIKRLFEKRKEKKNQRDTKIEIFLNRIKQPVN